MRLAIVCTMVKRFSRKGVYNSQEIGLARALTAMGHDVVIYKGTDDKSQVEDVQMQPGLFVRYLFLPHIEAHGYLRTGLLEKDFDGMICFSDQQIFIRHIWNFCRRNRIVFVPYIGTAHSMHVHTLRGAVMNRVFAATTLPVYRTMTVLAKTDAVKQELMDQGISEEQIRVAYVGIDASELKQDFQKEDRTAIRRELGFGEDEIVLCNVARLEPDKRTLDLLDLFAKVRQQKPFRLLIVGQGRLRPEIDQKIRDCGLEGEVTILDRVPYQDMWRIYVAADYYLNLSKVEIFGMAIMEAVYYHTSVAAIRALGPSVTLRDMPGHKLCENDDEIARWVLGPYPSEAQLAESAEKMIREFSWNGCAEAFVEAVREQRERADAAAGM